MHATPIQMKKRWHLFGKELATFGTSYFIHCISNKTDMDTTRLPFYKENLAGLKYGQCVGNSIIDFFAWKLFNRLDMGGVKDFYKRFRIMDSAFMYYMYIRKVQYDFNACRRWMTNKTFHDDGHGWSFL
jgi:hypothetical protein